MKNLKIWLSVLIILVTISCSKEVESEDIMSEDLICIGSICKTQEEIITDCLDEVIESISILQIFAQELDGELHYWLADNSIIDEDESIVDNNCDTKCMAGGWITYECYSDYDPEDWVLVYPF